MTTTTFFVPGHPVPAPRPRVTRTGTHYPKRYLEWKGAVAAEAMALSREMLTQPVMVAVRFTTSRHWQADLDNLIKSVLDALEGILYENDRQVTIILATKHRPTENDPEGVHVTISPSDTPSLDGGKS